MEHPGQRVITRDWYIFQYSSTHYRIVEGDLATKAVLSHVQNCKMQTDGHITLSAKVTQYPDLCTQGIPLSADSH